MVPLIILILVLGLVVFPIWVIVRMLALGRENNALAEKLAELERELRIERDQRRRSAAEVTPLAVTLPVSVSPPAPAPSAPPVVSPPPPVVLAATPPPLVELPLPLIPAESEPAVEPPPISPPLAESPARPAINWEQFMGAKLFAWLGGLAAFLAAAFFVKYSFEHNLIPPEMRVAIGYLFAIGLVIGGLKIPRERYDVTAQTLIATGIVSLDGVTFACNAHYHFPFFGLVPTFLLMALITAAAFLLAVRLEARVIAVLGILGGFLTPTLLSTGVDNPAGLFGYLALLNIGLIAVALHRRWDFLLPLGAGGTILMQFGWAERFLNAAKAPTAMIVCLSFCALFLAAYFVARRVGRGAASLNATPDEHGQADRATGATKRRVPLAFSSCAVAFPVVALLFATRFLGYGSVAAQPGLLFAFVFAADLCLLALAWFDEELPKLHLGAGVAVFALLAAWTGAHLTTALLPWALAAYLLHAALHTAFPLVLERHRPGAAPTFWSQLFPPLALLLMVGPLLKLDAVSLAFWPCVLLVDLIAIGLALVTASLVGVAVVLVLTLGATGLWMFHGTVTAGATSEFLFVIGGFAVIFFAAGIFLSRRLGMRIAAANEKTAAIFGDARAQIPAISALLPFLLLVMMTQRLPLANPSPVFGLALLLVVLTLGLTRLLAIAWLLACALAGVAALEYAWRSRHLTNAEPAIVLGWFVGFHAVFALFPFLFRSRFAALTGPWAVAALAGVAQFPLVYQLIERWQPNNFMGVLPALFALPPLVSLIAMLRAPIADERARLNQLAWFGGVALFFVTLIFPIQFERQWITVGWALEGVALLWFFHRVPHPALRATGVVLLAVAFARLALNSEVLGYHPRGAAIFNWYLYTFGIVAAALFVGARLLAPPRERTLGVNAPALLGTLGTVLTFLLLNIEIADFFSTRGTRALVFEFSGNFARDMTYTIAWALFALALLLVSFAKAIRAGRYAALVLLGVALLKLFFHDLAHLEALYRIGALFAVAVIAILASFAYQRFLPGHEKKPSDQP
ncbi:MAG: DUF2339 domain-containing protein [Opitutaceae bacterium]